MSELQLTKAEAEKLLDQYHARIAELEAENARLRDLGYGVERERDEARALLESTRKDRDHHQAGAQQNRAERDEARAEIGRLKSQHEIWSSDLRRERDEARAACVAKDEALRYVRSGLELEEVQDLEDEPGESLRIVAVALSSTAGSELHREYRELLSTATEFTVRSEEWKMERVALLAQLKMLEKAVENRGLVLDLETARLEKVGAELEKAQESYQSARDDREQLTAQLEAMRAVLERVKARGHGVGCASIMDGRRKKQPCNCGSAQAPDALLSSAPRLYRNSLIETMAVHFDRMGDEYVASHIRALKDPEEGT